MIVAGDGTSREEAGFVLNQKYIHRLGFSLRIYVSLRRWGGIERIY